MVNVCAHARKTLRSHRNGERERDAVLIANIKLSYQFHLTHKVSATRNKFKTDVTHCVDCQRSKSVNTPKIKANFINSCMNISHKRNFAAEVFRNEMWTKKAIKSFQSSEFQVNDQRNLFGFSEFFLFHSFIIASFQRALHAMLNTHFNVTRTFIAIFIFHAN